MKIKSFAMLAAAGLVAASCAYVAPAMADDTSATGQSAQTPTSTDNSATTPAPADQNNPGAMQDSNSSSSNSDTNSGASSNDTGTPDTATGDDDY